MEQEAMASWRVDELRHQLESARRESQDRAPEVTGARVAELHAVERAIAAERELDAAKVHLVETKAALQKSLEALEEERKAQSDAEQEVVALRGQMLGVEESNARLLERVTQQEEGISILKSACLGTYLFRPQLMP